MVTDLREQAARKILRAVRSQGHPYVELRPSGKKFLYFCTLCLAPCYSDTVLYDHLNGNLHKRRLDSAKITLLKQNPWPFIDGIVFFDTSTENNKDLGSTSDNRSRFLRISDNNDENNLAIVSYVEPVQSDAQPSSTDEAPDDDATLIIPNVLMDDEPVDLKIKDVGLGKIAARFFKVDDAFNGVRRIWCEWLGNENNDLQDGVKVPDHDYAVVIFSYNYILGRTGLLADIKSLLPSASMSEPDNVGESSRKRKMSDLEDTSYSLSNQCDSSVEGSPASSSATSTFSLTEKISMKAERKELRRKQRLAAEKMCNICQQKMLAGKDVAAFLNLKTKKIACDSRNRSRAFHVFHVSCVIHWILLCEFHIITDRLVLPKVTQGPKKKVAGNDNKTGKGSDMKSSEAHITSVFCPECSGSGAMVDGGGLEPSDLSISKIFKLKLKSCDARKEWIKSPEVLQNCSVGFHFPPESAEIVEEKVEPVKLLHFYRADQSRA
ncbi:hypothetical protein RIF29_05678 [Crotalaria pallida]|uniref:C2H2-type domain-containing protein n=1 Tax=Crotalaria pallida TaxID=3830 RepID=A0AAN9J2A9_CROPI